MNNLLFFSKRHFLHVYVETDLHTPKYVIAAPEEIRTWLVSGNAELLWICCPSGLYKVNIEEVFIQSKNNTTASVKESYEDCIFNQLLQDSASDPFQIESLPVDIYQITIKDLVLKDNNTVFLNEYHDLLLVTTKNDASFNVCVYQVKLLSDKKTPELQIKFSLEEFTRKPSKSVRDLSKTLNLFIITSNNFVEENTSTKCVNLPHQLFISLFNKESELLSSPVIVFCHQDGHVFFSYMKQNLMNLSKCVAKLCETGSHIIDVCGIKVIHCQTNSIEDKTSALYGADAIKELPALAVISNSGKVLLCLKVNSRNNWYSAVISGPVLCSCVQGNEYLFHSNGNYIYRSKFFFIDCDKRIEIDSTLLHDVKVRSMKLMKLDPSEEKFCLVCETMKNTIVSLPCVSSTVPICTDSLKDILLGIDHKRQKLEEISRHQTDLNSVLQQVNLAANILLQVNSTQHNSEKRDLILCEIVTEPILEGVSLEHRLLVQLKNQSKIKLSSDWSLLVHLPLLDQSKSVSHSIGIKCGLEHDGKFCIKVPITADAEAVEVNLILSILPRNKLHSLVPVDLCIPLYQRNLNILDFLLNAEDFNDNLSATKEPTQISSVQTSKIYTIQLLVSTKQIQSIITPSSETDPVSTDIILNSLMRNNGRSKFSMTAGVCKLHDIEGHIVTLSIQSKHSGEAEEGYIFNINSDYCPLLASVRAAILNNLKVCPSRDLSCVTSSDLNEYIKHLEGVKSNIEDMKTKLTENTEEENVNSMFIIYEKLRQTKL